eukprot:5628383-Prorocentrum_lima.AAC.1
MCIRDRVDEAAFRCCELCAQLEKDWVLAVAVRHCDGVDGLLEVRNLLLCSRHFGVGGRLWGHPCSALAGGVG